VKHETPDKVIMMRSVLISCGSGLLALAAGGVIGSVVLPAEEGGYVFRIIAAASFLSALLLLATWFFVEHGHKRDMSYWTAEHLLAALGGYVGEDALSKEGVDVLTKLVTQEGLGPYREGVLDLLADHVSAKGVDELAAWGWITEDRRRPYHYTWSRRTHSLVRDFVKTHGVITVPPLHGTRMESAPDIPDLDATWTPPFRTGQDD
jgi:hypothetical protein